MKGNHAFVLKDKFKFLRERFKWWNKEVFGWFDLRVEKVVTDLNDMDTLILRPPH